MQADPSASDKAVALASSGWIADAYHLLDEAARKGDALAAATLADWRMTGQVIRRDLGEARRLYGRAADLGIHAAEPIYTALLANGAGGSGRRWAAALDRLRTRSKTDPVAAEQLAMLERMELTAEGDPTAAPVGEQISRSPTIRWFPGFLTADECAFVVRLALPLLQDSVVVNPATGALVRNPIRTSKAAAFPFVLEDPVLHALNRRIAAASGTSYEQGEPVQVLSYEPGQEYKLHSDALPPGENQRAATVLVYLNEDYEGGETEFPAIDRAFRGRTGDAILFRNVDDSGEPDTRARHAGRPVTKGRKMLLSKWIRARPLDLSGPPGRPF